MKISPGALETAGFATLALLSSLVGVAAASGTESDFLKQLTESHARALEARTMKLDLEAQALKASYLEALERLQNSYQERGDLDGSIAVKAERERITGLKGLGEAITEKSELAGFEELRARFERSAEPMRSVFENDVAKLAAERNATLGEYISQLTRAGKIEEAIALDAKLKEWKEWEGERERDAGKTPENADELIAYLTETTWTYVNGGRPQYMRFFPGQFIMTMQQENISRNFGRHDYRIDEDLNVIWPYGDYEVRMEFDAEFLNYRSFKHRTDEPHRFGTLIHRGPQLLPD